MTHSHILIIGGGIVGLSIAHELIQRGVSSIRILEKEPALGYHASGRNSGVLHSGIYYKPNTLKATFTLEGNRQLKTFCRDHNLPLIETGKLVVPTSDSENETLETIYTRSKENGTPVSWVTPKQAHAIEPLAKVSNRALFSEETAIVDSKKVLYTLQTLLLQKGVIIDTQCLAERFETEQSIRTNQGIFSADYIINAAGAYADTLAHSLDLARNLKLIPFKGTYMQLTSPKADLVKGNIYPVPNLSNPFLGVHFTRHINGNVYVGPTAMPAFGPENYRVFDNIGTHSLGILYHDIQLFMTNPGFRSVALTEPQKYLKHFFFKAARHLVHDLTPQDLHPANKVGIRPQLVDLTTHTLVMDFNVVSTATSFHILNAISPAFTCSIPFAKWVVNQIML